MQKQSGHCPRHPELSLVSLGRSVASDDGVLPVGATGTVVHAYPDEQAYEVEFFHPFHTIATVVWVIDLSAANPTLVTAYP